MARPLVRPTASILSPLRYPGAKRRLSGYIAQTLRRNELHPKLFVEPFAGGASVSLQLLNDGLVDKVVLGERDPLVASFWKTVFYDSDWLVRKLRRVRVTLGRWEYYRNTIFTSHRDRALACIFLNRTSFSGILNETAGPLGGWEQKSEYKIDCRFPVETLIKRIQQAAALSEHVLFVNNGDWRETLRKVEELDYGSDEVCYFLDPPFYKKADRLYQFYFQHDEHTALHDALMKIRQPWILSYDPAKPIRDLYSHNGCGPKRIYSLYSADMNNGLQEVRELVITNLPELPRHTRLWRSNEEWRSPRTRASMSKINNMANTGRR